LDIICVSTALLGALASAWYYVLGVLDEDRALSRPADVARQDYPEWWRAA
jgi:hypothetical protein